MALFILNRFDLYAAPGKTPLSWQTRVQIAIDVANALVIRRNMLIFGTDCFAF